MMGTYTLLRRRFAEYLTYFFLALGSAAIRSLVLVERAFCNPTAVIWYVVSRESNLANVAFQHASSYMSG